ncbi:endonuclease/exonuclease/phosphatase family protein [Paenibacillus sp. BC26]|uniref:endonuclease/exonuclease/phosphatase family protein n=1 Tax=Paenibacillus sp. BC26 TaxID=1881032 RepID=UPI0008DF56C7|nr:endonuclease/exonuclease/phosphatase family protein [Paenibacillus sp. BC26]SFS56586.1 Metal-dependent hydrolase, endonuclease/exonuclease/phosphatase family [Paenibacillus sp. BC26]
MKIMTFNLRVHVESDGNNAWPNRIQEAAEAIKQADADVVGTQEGTAAMLQDLQALLPDYRWLGISRTGQLEGEYCAIFYRHASFEPVESGHFGLSEIPEQLGYSSWNSAYPRMCSWTKLRQPDGAEWVVFNTHLDHISAEARTNGVKLIVERMKQSSALAGDIPAVLTGDFNCGPDSDVIEALNELELVNAYTSLAGDAVGLTFHDYRGGDEGVPIDYIFVTPNAQVLNVHIDRNQYNGRFPSDHYPVVATVERRS